MAAETTILAIESSCDDTAAAVVVGGRLASSVRSVQTEHGAFGGVVPEIAGRAHQRLIVPVVDQALRKAGLEIGDVDALAATYGPGLAGSLLVGLSFAKAVSLALDVPFVGVNHVEGHLYSVFIDEPHPTLPYVCLTVSGGHTQIDLVRDHFDVEALGRTRDDAAGEAFDKVAKMLGLAYPGGPEIDRLARVGDESFTRFPRTRLDNPRGPFDFSFSGIKTAVLYHLNRIPRDEHEAYLETHRADLAASFQAAVVEVLVDALRDAVRITGAGSVAIVGGVAANSRLRTTGEAMARDEGVHLHVPSLEHSMDNAAMIGIAAHFRLAAGHASPLTLTAQPGLQLTP